MMNELNSKRGHLIFTQHAVWINMRRLCQSRHYNNIRIFQRCLIDWSWMRGQCWWATDIRDLLMSRANDPIARSQAKSRTNWRYGQCTKYIEFLVKTSDFNASQTVLNILYAEYMFPTLWLNCFAEWRRQKILDFFPAAGYICFWTRFDVLH